MKSKREEFGEKFFYIIFVLWLSTEILFSSTLKTIYKLNVAELNDTMAYVVLVLLVIQIIFFQQYSVNELVAISLMSLPIVYATINSNHNTMMATWIFIIAAKYMDVDKLMNIAYVVQVVMIALVIYLFLTGVIEEQTLYRGTVLRHSLGFSHPNQLGVRVFQLMVCRYYKKRKKVIFLDVVLNVGAAVFINVVANSKTCFYALVILSIMMLSHIIISMTNINLDSFIVYTILLALFSNIFSVIFSFVNVKKYALLNIIDKAMSRRFYHCYRTMKFYGVSLWGKDVQKIVKRHIIGRVYHFWLDNAYMTIVLRYGIIVFCIFSALYISTMFYLKKEKQFVLMEIMCIYAIYGIMENNYFAMSMNIFLLILSYPIYKTILPNEEMIRSRIRITV